MNPRLKRVIRAVLPRRVRKHRILRGPLRGARIVTSWHDYPGAILGSTETPLLNWLTKHVRCGETWLDVGAHYGYTAIAIARLVERGGRVLAFEPMLETAGYLTETRRLNGLEQLEVIPIALTDDIDVSLHRVPVERGMASPVTREASYTEAILGCGLDRLRGPLQLSDVHGVKIDVQGFEIQALRGMRGLLARSHPAIVMELHEGVDRASVRSILRELGYSLTAERVDTGTVDQNLDEDNVSYAFFPDPAVARRTR